jgi:hypothetical protein
MNSYLLEWLAKERAESWRRQGLAANRLRASTSPVTPTAARFPGFRFSINGAREATSLVDCR